MTPNEQAVASIEAAADTLIKSNANRMVPWYLILSYLYYVHDISATSDTFFDKLCKRLLDEWDSVEHYHKHHIDREQLTEGTGYYLKFEGAFGSRIDGAAGAILRQHMPWAMNRPKPTRKRKK